MEALTDEEVRVEELKILTDPDLDPYQRKQTLKEFHRRRRAGPRGWTRQELLEYAWNQGKAKALVWMAWHPQSEYGELIRERFGAIEPEPVEWSRLEISSGLELPENLAAPTYIDPAGQERETLEFKRPRSSGARF